MVRIVCMKVLSVDPIITLDLPENSQLLSVAFHPKYGPVAWALVDPKAATCKRRIRMAEAGDGIAEVVGAYLGSISSEQGSFVFHYFDLGETCQLCPPPLEAGVSRLIPEVSSSELTQALAGESPICADHTSNS